LKSSKHVSVHRAMMKRLISILSAFVLCAGRVAADTNYVACNPTKNSTCPPDLGLPSLTVVDFTRPYPDGLITTFSQNSITRDHDGLHITINAIGEQPFLMPTGITQVRGTLIVDYIFFGRVSAIIKATNASAISTFFNFQADNLDEVDFSCVGNETSAHATYYSRGGLRNVTEPNVFNVSAPHATFHSKSREVRSDFQITRLIGLRRELSGSSTASPLAL
jgi:Glycosyl hydrolases family 16